MNSNMEYTNYIAQVTTPTECTTEYKVDLTSVALGFSLLINLITIVMLVTKITSKISFLNTKLADLEEDISVHIIKSSQNTLAANADINTLVDKTSKLEQKYNEQDKSLAVVTEQSNANKDIQELLIQNTIANPTTNSSSITSVPADAPIPTLIPSPDLIILPNSTNSSNVTSVSTPSVS